MNVVPFEAEHINQLELQDAQSYLSAIVSSDQAEALVGDWAFSAMEDGRPIASAGVILLWQGRGMAWAFISKYAVNNKFLQVHRAVKRFLDGCYLQRIEMTVDCEFEQAHRWAHMLGFHMECARMRSYRPDGGDCALYARVR